MLCFCLFVLSEMKIIVGVHTTYLATANMLDIFGWIGLKMLLFFIKDDEDTLPNATIVLDFLLIQFRVSSLLSLIA